MHAQNKEENYVVDRVINEQDFITPLNPHFTHYQWRFVYGITRHCRYLAGKTDI